MTYHVLVQFDVPSDKREAFAAAGLFDANGSLQNEPGTLRFEVIRDENNRNRFYLDEVYEDEAAFLQGLPWREWTRPLFFSLENTARVQSSSRWPSRL